MQLDDVNERFVVAIAGLFKEAISIVTDRAIELGKPGVTLTLLWDCPSGYIRKSGGWKFFGRHYFFEDISAGWFSS